MKRTRYPGVKPLGDNTYSLRVKTIDPRTGRAKEVKRIVTCAGGSAEAAALRLKLLEEVASGGPSASDRVRLADFAHSWLRGKLPLLKASTRSRYAEILDTAILPALGDFYLDALRPSDVQAWVADLTPRYRPQTVISCLRVLRTMCRDAVADLDLPRDPCLRVKAPRPIGFTDEEPNLLQPDELRALLEEMRESAAPWYPITATLALTGLRWGEATALRWEDLDEAAGLIRVRRSQWRGLVATTKTGKTRSVPLVPDLARILRDHRATLTEREAASGWVFPSNVGKPLQPSVLRKPLLRALATACPGRKLSVHGLRRTFNNLARQVAAGDVVRSITGHVTVAMTEHYSVIGAAEKQVVGSRVLALIQGGKTESGSLGGSLRSEAEGDSEILSNFGAIARD